MIYDQEKQDFKLGRGEDEEKIILLGFEQYIHSLIQSFDDFKSLDYIEVFINDEISEEERFLREKKRKKAFEANENFLTTDHEFIY